MAAAGLADITGDMSKYYDQFGNPNYKLGQNNGLSSSVIDNFKNNTLTNTFSNNTEQGKALNEQWSINSPTTIGPTGFIADASNWLKDQGNVNLLQAGMGIGNLGLGLASYLQQSKYLKKQGNLLDQQIANNAYEMNQRKRMNAALDAQHV